MASLKHYAPSDVTITIAAFHSVSGYADGTFVSIKKDTQQMGTIRAMDGTMSRIKSPDTGWKVELTLAQTSDTNDVLSILWNADKLTGLGKFPLFIKDGNGSTMFMAASAWVESVPDVVFSNQMETRTWTLSCTDVVANIGGNGGSELLAGLGIATSALNLLSTFSIG